MKQKIERCRVCRQPFVVDVRPGRVHTRCVDCVLDGLTTTMKKDPHVRALTKQVEKMIQGHRQSHDDE
jgi:hypothetical protein